MTSGSSVLASRVLWATVCALAGALGLGLQLLPWVTVTTAGTVTRKLGYQLGPLTWISILGAVTLLGCGGLLRFTSLPLRRRLLVVIGMCAALPAAMVAGAAEAAQAALPGWVASIVSMEEAFEISPGAGVWCAASCGVTFLALVALAPSSIEPSTHTQLFVAARSLVAATALPIASSAILLSRAAPLIRLTLEGVDGRVGGPGVPSPPTLELGLGDAPTLGSWSLVATLVAVVGSLVLPRWSMELAVVIVGSAAGTVAALAWTALAIVTAADSLIPPGWLSLPGGRGVASVQLGVGVWATLLACALTMAACVVKLRSSSNDSEPSIPEAVPARSTRYLRSSGPA